MHEQYLGPYQRDIVNRLGCPAEDAATVEDIMRNYVFHSTLDWQSAAQFHRGVREAWEIPQADREPFDDCSRQKRQIFEEMEATLLEAREEK